MHGLGTFNTALGAQSVVKHRGRIRKQALLPIHKTLEMYSGSRGFQALGLEICGD